MPFRFSMKFFLLNTGFSKTFETFVEPVYLYGLAVFFFILTAAVVIITYIILNKKKAEHHFKKGIRESIEGWINEAMINESDTNTTVPSHFNLILKKQEGRQLLIDELVRNKTSFSGGVSANIRHLYCQLGLNVDSVKKLNASRVHIQCQGIYELCVMDQNSEVKKVYRLTNSKDQDVRIEAQTAIIQWYGFKGLRFLDVVSYPITEFQQLKLLELLRILPFTGFSHLGSWLASANDTVVIFALKLARHYQEDAFIREAEECLKHSNEAVRIQAVKTVAVIGDACTTGLLTKTYQQESFTNRLNILMQLPAIAEDEQTDFLVDLLDDENEYLKLASAKVLAKCTTRGMKILEAKSIAQPVPYREIYMHVKWGLTT